MHKLLKDCGLVNNESRKSLPKGKSDVKRETFGIVSNKSEEKFMIKANDIDIIL